MNIFPFYRKQFIIDMEPEKVQKALLLNISPPDRNFTFQKAVLPVIEGDFHDNRFTLVAAKYGLTFGRNNFLPYLIGRILPLKDGRTCLKIRIQPGLNFGLGLLILVYVICASGIYLSWQQEKMSGVFVCGILMAGTYIVILTRFNSDKKKMMKFISDKLNTN